MVPVNFEILEFRDKHYRLILGGGAVESFVVTVSA